MRPPRRDIDQTLEISGEKLERDVAFYRVIAMSIATVATLINRFASGDDNWAVVLYFAAYVVVAVGIWQWILRRGVSGIASTAALLFDMCVVTMVTPIMNLIDPTIEPGVGAIWSVFLLGPSALIILLLNMLRYSRVLSVLGPLFAIGLYLTSLTLSDAWPPAHLTDAAGAPFVAISLFVIAGAVSWLAARQQRKTLEDFARYKLLERWLPAEAVRRVLREDLPLAVGGRLATVTLVATDLRGFTSLSEKLEPGEVVEQLNAYHAAMLEEIEQHGGMLDKFMGDGSLAIFGLQERGDGAGTDCGAAAAVSCARGMLAALELHNAQRAKRGLTPLKMGIGIHTGPVIAGNIGAPGRRLEFTVIGDAANTASRLESLTKEIGVPVAISADTVAKLPRELGNVCREHGTAPIRGRAESVRIFTLATEPLKAVAG